MSQVHLDMAIEMHYVSTVWALKLPDIFPVCGTYIHVGLLISSIYFCRCYQYTIIVTAECSKMT